MRLTLSSMRVAVIGGGMAGLSAASALVRRGAQKVEIFESEDLIFTQSSGKNAAIFRPLENDLEISRLAAESLPLLEQLGKRHRVPLLKKCGLILLHHHKDLLIPAFENAQELGIHCEWLDHARLTEIAGEARLRRKEAALWSRDGGVLDPHAIGLALQKELKESSSKIHFHSPVKGLIVEEGTCRALDLGNGRELHFDAVVLAGGASAARLAYAAASPIPLLNLQRHLALLETPAPLAPETPVVWQLDPEVYFRAESGGVLVSPCDESPRENATPQASLDSLSVLEARLAEASEAFSLAKLRRFWACIRTKAPDGRPVIGADPKIEGLYWIAGLGGFGMSCGLSAGERLADCLTGGASDNSLEPGRFRHEPAASILPLPSLKL